MRVSKKLRSDELLIESLGSTILRKHLDEVPLWRGDNVAVKQLVDDFARYLYLPRLAGPEVLAEAMRDGVALLTWRADTFAYAESYRRSGGALSRPARRARDQHLSRQSWLAREAGRREQAIGRRGSAVPKAADATAGIRRRGDDSSVPASAEPRTDSSRSAAFHALPRLGARGFGARRTRRRSHRR